MLLEIYKRLLEYFGPQNWWPVDWGYHKRNKTDWRFEVIIGAILTQNTRWKNVEKALENLKKEIILDCRKILNLSVERLSELIRPVGFYRIKAERLMNFCKFLCERYGCNLDKLGSLSLEELREKLLSIKGIGKETADAIILYAFEKPIFVVDVYTRRIFSRIGLVRGNEEYNEIRKMFEREIDRKIKKKEKLLEIFKEYHALIDELAKNICKKEPKCRDCPIKDICGYHNLYIAKGGMMRIWKEKG